MKKIYLPFLDQWSFPNLLEPENIIVENNTKSWRATEKQAWRYVHVGRNDITNGVNPLNCIKKIVKQVSDISPRTIVAFSFIIVRKDKKKVQKPLTDAGTRLKISFSQKGISFIENSNIKESNLGKKKFHLYKSGKTFFAKNLINYNQVLK